MAPPKLFDRKLLLSRRNRAAQNGELTDFLLERTATEMAERLQGVEREFENILIAGAYHGLLARKIEACANPGSRIVAMEPDPTLLSMYGGLKVRADEELLPFRNGAFDLVLSGLSLHLVNDLPGALIQIRRALKPDGLFLGAVLGGATLQELREAFIQAETELEGGISPRIAPMADIRDYGALLQRAGFALPVADADLVEVTYRSPLALMRDLRNMGASNMLSERRKTPLRRSTLARAVEIYQQRFPAGNGRIRASFEILHLAGWAPHESQQKPLRPGSATTRLAEALGVEEHILQTPPVRSRD